MTGAPKVEIHTDGACSGNPGPGGWAALLRSGPHEKMISGGEPATTNNRMELTAAIRALEALRQASEVVLWTDSEYLRRGVTEWMPRWKANGWRNAAKQPVANRELWEELDTLAGRHRIDWRWVRGHSGHPENDRVDAAARAAVLAQPRTRSA
jgi:ribonuclease HI